MLGFYCRRFSRSFALERPQSLSCPLGIWRLVAGCCGVALVALELVEHIFLGGLAELVVAEQLDRMGSMAIEQLVVQRKLVERKDFAELELELAEQLFGRELVVEHKLVVVELVFEQLVFALGLELGLVEVE